MSQGRRTMVERGANVGVGNSKGEISNYDKDIWDFEMFERVKGRIDGVGEGRWRGRTEEKDDRHILCRVRIT